LAEFQVLLDLTSERLFDLQRDFLALQAQMVKCHAMLATLVPESQPCDQPPGGIWDDQPSA
jgi:hypothetical protein